MIERAEHIAELLHKRADGSLTSAEATELLAWSKEHESHAAFIRDIGSERYILRKLQTYREIAVPPLSSLPQLAKVMSSRRRPIRVVPRWLPYVAASLLVTITIAWLVLDDQLFKRLPTGKQPQLLSTDIAPAGNRALLSVADGRTLALDSTQNRIIFSGEKMTYANDQSISGLDLTNKHSARHVSRFTLTTPRGGLYQVVLPDGTEVWLNAASSLTYPIRFEGNTREVQLTGEAYFAVTPDKHRPFKVASSGQTIEVLGTEFNIAAYPDEPDIQTTLIFGSVRLIPSNGSLTPINIHPGEQATLQGDSFRVRSVEVEDHIGWKSGVIILDRADLPSIIRQIERWYDVEFDRDGWSTDTKLNGILHRTANLSAVLKVLSLNTGKTYRIAGRRVMVE